MQGINNMLNNHKYNNSTKKENEARENLEKAQNAHQRYIINSYPSDLEEAIEHYITAVKLNPNVAKSYYRLACLLYEDGQISLDTAASQCLVAVNMEPDNINAKLYYGHFLQLMGSYEKAKEQFKNAIKLSPFLSSRPRLILSLNYLKELNETKFSFIKFSKFLYYFISGSIMLISDKASLSMLQAHLQKDFTRFLVNFWGDFFEKIKANMLASKVYDRAIKKDNKNCEFYSKKGDLLIKQQNIKEALKYYNKILEINPNDTSNIIKLATLNQSFFKENVDETISLYTRLLELGKTDDKIYFQLGHLYLQKEERINACNAFKLALKESPNNPYYHNSLAFAYVNLGLYDEAIEHYKEAIRINPDNEWTAIVCQALASIYFEIKNNNEIAVSLLETAIALNPNCEEAYVGLGDIYANLDKIDEAMKYYNEALNINPDNPRIYGKCGIAFWEHDYVEEAIIAYNKAIELNPNYDIAYNNLGVIYLDGIGNIKEALKLFDKAISINPNYALANFNAARACEIILSTHDAISYYQKALEINRQTKELDENEIISRLKNLFD